MTTPKPHPIVHPIRFTQWLFERADASQDADAFTDAAENYPELTQDAKGTSDPLMMLRYAYCPHPGVTVSLAYNRNIPADSRIWDRLLDHPNPHVRMGAVCNPVLPTHKLEEFLFELDPEDITDLMLLKAAALRQETLMEEGVGPEASIIDLIEQKGVQWPAADADDE